MKNSLKYYLLFLSVLISGISSGQVQRGDYCSCKTGAAYKINNKQSKKGLYGFTYNTGDSLFVSIVNPTKDTLYLFSSYLHPQFYASEHLHRVNYQSKFYKVSFLPIVSHIFVKYSDNITGDPIVGQNQVVYDFVKLLPHTKAVVKIGNGDLLRNVSKSNNVSTDYDVRKLNKYSKTIPTKLHTLNLLKSSYKTELEFAVYKSVSMLCNQTEFYNSEAAFDRQSKEFKVLIVPFQLTGKYSDRH